MSTIAMFSNYAPSEGFGGPSRIFHARRVLESAGHTVVHVVVQATADRGAARRDDIVKLLERPHRAPFDHIYHDVELGKRAAADTRLVEGLVVELANRGVSLILLEQPFLVGLVAQIASRLDVPVVYSCHNIEYRLRRDLERFQADWKRPVGREHEVRQMEAAAIDAAAAVTTIAETDRELLLDEFGVDSTVVPNGTSVADLVLQDPTRDDVDFAFVGSAYWPNIEGFSRVAAPSLGFLPPTTRVHVAGAVSAHLLENRDIVRCYSVNASRMVLHGFLPMSDLLTLIASARSVIVPIFVGEGSNLKSADALACGAPVILTRRATRGYESVIAADPEGVTVVDDPTQFREAMRAAMAGPRRAAAIGAGRHRLLTWTSRLQPLIDVVDSTARPE